MNNLDFVPVDWGGTRADAVRAGTSLRGEPT